MQLSIYNASVYVGVENCFPLVSIAIDTNLCLHAREYYYNEENVF